MRDERDRLISIDWPVVMERLRGVQCPHGGGHAPGEIGIRDAMSRLRGLNATSAKSELLSKAALSGIEDVFVFLEKALSPGRGFVSDGGLLDLDANAAIFSPEQDAVIRMICGVEGKRVISIQERAVGLCRLAQAINAYVAEER